MSAFKADAIIGTTSAAIGSGGITYQMVTQTLSVTALVVNLILAVAGGYLLWLRIRKAKRELRDG